MKKQFLLVGTIAAIAFGSFLVSCSDDDEDKGGVSENGCVCDVMDDKGKIQETENFSQSQLSAYSSCADYASFMMKQQGANFDGSITCRNR